MPITSRESKVKLHIPREVEEKILYLTRAIPDVEWSGILLYTSKGTMTEPDKFEITLKDIILMDKGSASYTSFKINEKKRDQSGYIDRHIDYVEEYPESIEWTLGLIHSHQNFGVFFSGTDLEELQENSPLHNHYLSLIVNNKMEMVAKIAQHVKGTEKVQLAVDVIDVESGKKKTIKTKEERAFETIFTYDCEITLDGKEDVEDNFFYKNVFDVLEEHNKPAPTTTIKNNNTLFGDWDRHMEKSSKSKLENHANKDLYSKTLEYNASKDYLYGTEDLEYYDEELEGIFALCFLEDLEIEYIEYIDKLEPYIYYNTVISKLSKIDASHIDKVVKVFSKNFKSSVEYYYAYTTIKENKDILTNIVDMLAGSNSPILEGLVEHIENILVKLESYDRTKI